MKALKWSRRRVIIAVALMAAALTASHFVPRFIVQDRRFSCLSNLKQIDGAVVSVSLENRLYVGNPVPLGRVAECLRGYHLPTCRSGGHYVIGLVGDTPSCSYHGDLLRTPSSVSEVSTNIPTKWFLFRKVQSPTFSKEDMIDLAALAQKLKQPRRSIDKFLRSQLSWVTTEALAKSQGADSDPNPLQTVLLRDINNIVRGPLLYTEERFAGFVLRTETALRLPMRPQGDELVSLNRLLLEDAYPAELSR